MTSSPTLEFRSDFDEQTAYERFYRPEHGGVILNPLDERSPYWPVGEEIEHEAEARTVAESAFPDRPNEPH